MHDNGQISGDVIDFGVKTHLKNYLNFIILKFGLSNLTVCCTILFLS